MVEHLGEDLAYHIWHANNGHSIELTKEGKPSELYNSLVSAYGNEKQAYEAKSKTFSNAFRKWYGNNEEPKLEGNKLVNVKGEGIEIVGSKEPVVGSKEKEESKQPATTSIAELAKAAVAKATKEQEKEITETDSKIQNIESKPKITAKPEKIDDIGEKIGGAKKDLFKEYQKKLAETTDEDILKLPLSKSFPRPNFAQLLEDGKMTQETSIFLSYFYDEIPTKPQKTYKVKAWVEKVRGALDVFNTVLGKKPDRDLMQEFIDKMNSDKYAGSVAFQAEAYRAIKKAINFPNNEVNTGNLSIGRYHDSNGTYTYAVKIPVGDRVRLSERYDTLDKAISKLIEMSKESAGKPKQIEFSVYFSRKTGDYFITPKGKGDVVLQNGFKTSEEAFNYTKESSQELQDRYNALKDIPDERRITNNPRVGYDYRQGKDISPDNFRNEFGFRGVEFGNWVNQEERQAHINEAYDALMDLSTVIGVSPKALSLNGQLGFAFGSRGGGYYAAHYEPDKVVINLTKTKGSGCLAHEWFHALDNYLLRSVGNASSYATDGGGFTKQGETALRPELNAAFRNLMKVIRKTGFYTRSSYLDRIKGRKYWGTSVELGARGFEDFVMNKLAKSNIQNDYLVNFKSLSEFIDNVNGDISDISKKYPYPTVEESQVINEAYQNIFDMIQEDNNHALFQIKPSENGFYSTAESALDKITQEKGTKDQFKAMLLKNGAKQAELDWLGFDELPDKLTKTDIQKWIDENKIDVKEVVKEQIKNTSDRGFDNMNDQTKFSQYTLPGGENYKEFLLTMPSFSEERYRELSKKVRNETETDDELMEFEKLDQLKHGKTDFKSAHYDEPNILAHIRFNEREVNGEKVLFVEEFQSDWAQKGKKEGFGGNLKDLPAGYTIQQTGDSSYEIMLPNAIRPYVVEANGFQQAKEKALADINRAMTNVPKMPFQKTDQWLNLAARRMMRYAAEHGFDRIAWTNGEQQADRYDLSKQVDAISTYKNGGGKWNLSITLKGNPIYQNYENLDENKIEDYVGKELAKKIINNEGEKLPRSNERSYQHYIYSGDGLKVGGEGMKAFYDGIVPSTMGKLGKPFRAKVEKIRMKLTGMPDSEYDKYPEGHPYVQKNAPTVQSIPVTDSMKKSVMEGIPLFQINKKAFDTTKTPEERFAAGKEIVSGLDDMLGYETSTVKNNDELIEILPDYEEFIKTRKVGGVFYKGEAIVNCQHQKSAKELIAAYFHENTHGIVRQLYSRKEVIDIFNSLPANEQVPPEGYDDISEYQMADEIIAHAIEDIVNKEGYENMINGNVDLSLYSESLQNVLKEIINYYGNSKLQRSNTGREYNDKIAGERNGDIENIGSKNVQNTDGSTERIETPVSGTESGGSEGILPGADEIKTPAFKLKDEEDTPTPPKYSAEKSVSDYAVEIDKYNKRLEAIEYRKKQLKEDHDEKKITNIDFAKGVKNLADEKFDLQTKIKRIKAGTSTPEELEGKKTGDSNDVVDPVKEHQVTSDLKKPKFKDYKGDLVSYVKDVDEYNRKKREETEAASKAALETENEPQLKDFVGRPYSDYESALAQYRTARAVLKNEPIPEIKKQYRIIVQGLKTAKDEVVTTDIPEIRTLYSDMESDWLGNRDVEKAKAMVEAKTLQDQIKATVKDSKQKWQDVDKAIHVYIDMKNDPTAIDRYYDELTDPQKHIIDIAKQLTSEQTAIADKIAKEYENLGKKALDEEVISNIYDNYVRRQWDITGEKGRDYFAKFSTSTSHAKHRKLTSIIEGWAGGLNLKTEGATNNLQALKEEINAVIENKKLLKAGMSMKGENGVPLFTLTKETGYEEIKHPNFRKWVQWKNIDAGNNISGENWAIDKDGNVFEKKKIYAPKEIADRINNILTPYDNGLTGPVKGIVNSLDKLNAVAKSTILSFSFYHHQAFARQYMFGAVFNGPKDVNLFSAYKEGFNLFMNMSPEVEMLIRGGMTVGRIQDWQEDLVQQKGMIQNTLDKWKVSKDVQGFLHQLHESQTNFLFNYYGIGLKVKMATTLLHEQIAKKPDVDVNKLAKEVGEFANNSFGGLNNERNARSKKIQKWLHRLILAPDWTESNLKSLLGAIGFDYSKFGEQGYKHGFNQDKEQAKRVRQLYQKLFAKSIVRSNVVSAIWNVLIASSMMALLSSDKEDSWLDEIEKLYKDTIDPLLDFNLDDESFMSGMRKIRDVAVKSHFSDADISFIPEAYDKMTGKEFDEDKRYYFSTAGHFKDPAKWIIDPTTAAKHKASVLLKIALDATNGKDWQGKRFTTVDEFLGTDDKGVYQKSLPKKGIHAGDPKGGQLKLQTVKYGLPSDNGAVQMNEMPSFVMNELMGFLPVPLHNALNLTNGELDAFTTMTRGIGMNVSSEKMKDQDEIKYEIVDKKIKNSEAILKGIKERAIEAKKKGDLGEMADMMTRYNNANTFKQQALSDYTATVKKLKREVEDAPDDKKDKIADVIDKYKKRVVEISKTDSDEKVKDKIKQWQKEDNPQ